MSLLYKTLMVVATAALFVFAGAAISHSVVGDPWLGAGLGACVGFTCGLLIVRNRVEDAMGRTIVTLNTSAATCFGAATITAGAGRLRAFGLELHPSLVAVAMFLAAGLACLVLACRLASRSSSQR